MGEEQGRQASAPEKLKRSAKRTGFKAGPFLRPGAQKAPVLGFSRAGREGGGNFGPAEKFVLEIRARGDILCFAFRARGQRARAKIEVSK